jgi:hypothetical protein
MSFLVANIPPVHSYIRREFLYDFERGHGEYEPCIWVSIKSIRGQAFRIEAYLPNYGALYDKLPLHAFVSRTENLDISKFLPLDTLQIWDCFDYNMAVIQKAFLRNLSCKFYAKDKNMYSGNYMFTVDNAHPDHNLIDTGYSEWPEDHKSFNFIELDNGQYAAQPNNRCLFYDAASNPTNMKFPDFKVCTKKYVVEQNPKWRLGDTDTVMYEKTNQSEDYGKSQIFKNHNL